MGTPTETNTETFVKRLAADPHFKSGEPAIQKLAYAAPIYAFITSAEGLAVITFTKAALEVVDKVVDIVKKALGKGAVKVELVCPDGKTKSTIEGSQEQVIVLMAEFLKRCGKPQP